MDALQITLFGRFCVKLGNRPIVEFNAHRVKELLGYLLINRNHPHPRESLAGLFWGDVPAPQSRSYLRKAIWQLQTLLHEDNEYGGENQPALFLIDQDWIQFNPLSTCWIDIAVFERVYQQLLGVPGSDLGEEQAALLENTVKLYQGDLLVDCYQDWCLLERQRLQHIYLSFLDKLIDHAETHGNYESGLAYGEIILRYDRARETAHQQMMRLYYLAGNRTGALRQYRACAALLWEELGVKPSIATEQLCKSIENDCLGQSIQSTGTVCRGEANQVMFTLLDHLLKTKNTLADMQTQIQQDILSIRRSMENR